MLGLGLGRIVHHHRNHHSSYAVFIEPIQAISATPNMTVSLVMLSMALALLLALALILSRFVTILLTSITPTTDLLWKLVELATFAHSVARHLSIVKVESLA